MFTLDPCKWYAFYLHLILLIGVRFSGLVGSASSSSKLPIASGVMSPIILVSKLFWAVIVSRVVVLLEATILNLVVGDGGRFWVVDLISLTVAVDKTPVSCLLNLGNHRCQCKGHDYCRELCLLRFVMCFPGSAMN